MSGFFNDQRLLEGLEIAKAAESYTAEVDAVEIRIQQLIAQRQEVAANAQQIWDNPDDLASLNAKLAVLKSRLQSLVDGIPG